MHTNPAIKHILFLQTPTNTLFSQISASLSALGNRCYSINLSMGGRIFNEDKRAVAFRETPENWAAFIAQFLAENNITDILLLGEQRFYHRVAIEKARALGINVYVTDFGYVRPDWVILERDGMNGDSRFTRDPAEILRLAESLPPVDRTPTYRDNFLKQALWDMAFHLSQVIWPYAFPHYRRHMLVYPPLVYLGIGLRLVLSAPNRRRTRRVLAEVDKMSAFYVFAMQTEDDFSIRAYSHYPDLDTPMRETIESFAAHAAPQSVLVFKIHPLDPGLKRWRRRIAKMAEAAGVASRVFYIDGGNLDDLLQRAAGLVTVNSTVGLRAIELGCPVIALGQAIYRLEGLTFESPLDEFWRHAKKPDAALADAYLRAIVASLHVRGSYYNDAGIKAAAEAMAHRIHHGLVNVPIAAVNRGERLTLSAR